MEGAASRYEITLNCLPESSPLPSIVVQIRIPATRSLARRSTDTAGYTFNSFTHVPNDIGAAKALRLNSRDNLPAAARLLFTIVIFLVSQAPSSRPKANVSASGKLY